MDTSHGIGAWRLALVYGAGIYCALLLWFAIVVFFDLPGQMGRGKAEPAWAFVIYLIPFALGTLGFRGGMIGFDASAAVATRRRLLGTALLLGALWPLSVLVLRPVFAGISRGLLPALVWVLVGSALAAICFRALIGRGTRLERK